MESLNRDVGGKILLNLSYEDMSMLCKIKENIKIQQLCENKDFWRSKILKDFPRRYSTIKNPSLIAKFKQDPKSLYEFINKPSKRWDITSEEAPELHEYFPDISSIWEFEIRALEILNEELKQYPYTFPVLRGDVFNLPSYSNERGENLGKYMWDGDKIVSLSYEVALLGSAPNTFSFPEFPLNHFKYSLPVDPPIQDTIIYLSSETMKEVSKNFSDDSKQTFITDNYYKYYFEVNPDFFFLTDKQKIRAFLSQHTEWYPFYEDTLSGKFILNKLMKFTERKNIY